MADTTTGTTTDTGTTTIEAYNRNGILACRAVVTHRVPPGVCLMYHANDRHLNVPRTELKGTRWEDQERWRGGWTLDRRGTLRLKAGGQLTKLLTIFWNPNLPAIDDYYEPWTYDYETLITAPLSEHDPVAQPYSQLTGQTTSVRWGPNWEDDLAGAPEHAPHDPNLERMARLEPAALGTDPAARPGVS